MTTNNEFTWGGITHRIVNMTPALASELLRTNDHNRNIRKAITTNYVSDMRSGAWVYAGDPIRISQSGVLLDGQHRLTAVSSMPPGWSTPMLIIEGLDDNAQLVMDQGRRRSPGQQLQLLGYSDANQLASVVRALIEWREGLMFRDTEQQAVITSSRIQEFVEDNPTIPNLVTDIRSKARNSYMSPSIMGAFYIEAVAVDKDIADDFMTQLVDGIGLEAGSAILALRERAIRNQADRRRDSHRSQLGLLVTAWNAHWSGRTMQRMQLPKGGAFTEANFPKMIR